MYKLTMKSKKQLMEVYYQSITTHKQVKIAAFYCNKSTWFSAVCGDHHMYVLVTPKALSGEQVEERLSVLNFFLQSVLN